MSRYLLPRIRLITRFLHQIKYPELGIAGDVNFIINGQFAYGKHCGIGIGANIIIPKSASLVLGEHCYIGRHVELGPGGFIQIADYTSVQDRCVFLGDVTIGRYCSFAPNVYISSGRHYYNLKPSFLIKDQDKMVSQDEILKRDHSHPVTIGDDCWIGINSVIMSGITIGKGAIIGANSVVTKNVAPYTIVGGVPAKLIKKRLDFVPPNRILYTNPHDWPYFYSGFEMSQASMEKYSIYRGIATLNEFTICLDMPSAKSIHLIVRKIETGSCSLKFKSQQVEISQKFQEVEFARDIQPENFFLFQVQSDRDAASLIIQEAWLQ